MILFFEMGWHAPLPNIFSVCKMVDYLMEMAMFWNKDKELVKFAEREAKIAEHFAIECIDELIRQSSHLLSVLLSGAGGGLALAVSLMNQGADEWLVFATAVVSVYLFLICAMIVLMCLWSDDVYPPANSPKNLYQEGVSVYQIRKEELFNRQMYIEKNAGRAHNMAYWLNLARSGAVLTPVVFALSAWIYFLGCLSGMG